MDFIDYRRKLGIGFDNQDLENLFFNRMFNILDGLCNMSNQISVSEYFNFCLQTGYPMQHDTIEGEGWDIVMKILHSNSRTIKEFLPYYMYFINCQKDAKYKSWTKEHFKNLVCKCLKQTHIPFDLLEDNGEYFLFPKGAEELDSALVSEPLLWLNDYPASHKAFVKALKAYSIITEDNASDVADLFRKALETFFQEFYKSDKSLENLRSEYGNFLNRKGVPTEISNNFEKMLESYIKYNNNYVKHHDKASLDILEYIMYQTGNLIRLIITLNREGDANAN